MRETKNHRLCDFILRNLVIFIMTMFFLLVSGMHSYASNKVINEPGTMTSDNILEQRKVTGTVTDSDGKPLPGVTVLVKGTRIGAITDANGNYSVDAEESQILEFSFIGMKTIDRPASSLVINVSMEQDVFAVDAVVVTALGVKRDRKSLGYAISRIEGEVLTVAGNPVNPLESLHGKAPGVTIRQSVSGPTGGIDINIRGNSALEFESSTRPLIVVDGVPIHDQESAIVDNKEYKGDYGAGINDLNASDIESIEILKGAKASVLYGSQGANGVVLITTKSGKGSKGIGVEVNYQYSLNKPKSYMELQNEYGSGLNEYDWNYLDIDGVEVPAINGTPQNFGPKFDGRDLLYWDGVTRPYQAYPNNFMFFYQNGHTQSTNAAISSSGDFGHTRLSYTNYDYQGITPDFYQKKNTVSFAGQANISDRISLDYATNLYDIKTHNRLTDWAVGMVNGINRDLPWDELARDRAYLINDPDNPNYGYLADEAYREQEDPNFVDGIIQSYYPIQQAYNALWKRDMNSALDDKFHIIGSLRPTIRFNEWLYFVGQASLDYTQIDYTTETSPTSIYPGIVGAAYRVQKESNRIEEYRAFLNFEKDFTIAGKTLNVFAFGGPSYRNVKNDKMFVSTSDREGDAFTYADWFHIHNQNTEGWPTSKYMNEVRDFSFGENSMYSLIGVTTFTYNYKYTLELNARNDWTSTLLAPNNSYFYPGAAITYDFTTEAKKLLPKLQFGKIRTSFADVGRDAPSRYFAYQSLVSGQVNGTDVLYADVSKNLYASLLKPERKREWEIGTEISFFSGNRLMLDASYYINHVYDQLISVNLTPMSGASSIKINAGDIKNWGYELQLAGTPVMTKGLRWDLVLNVANQYNKILELYPGLPEKEVKNLNHGLRVMAKEGERSGNIYGIGPRYVESGEFEGQPIVEGSGVSYNLDGENEILVGNIYPDIVGGFTSNLNYKGFNLTMMIDYSFGATLYSWPNYALKGTGTSMESLEGRDEAHGGLAYYIDADGNNIPWDHNQAAPAESVDGYVYHDGIVLEGVQEDNSNPDEPVYTKNETIVSAASYYYNNFVFWTNGQLLDAVNDKYDNDYIKLREVSLSYKFPQKITSKLSMKKLSVGVFARNLGYLYKTLPNFDAESASGTKAFTGSYVIPSAQYYGFKLSCGF